MDSSAVQVFDGKPTRMTYVLSCNAGWETRHLLISVVGADRATTTELSHDGSGRWQTGDGEALTDLDGCIDVDISWTPATNTLPIRRLALARGESRVLKVAYLDLPELTLSAMEQTYTCLERSDVAGQYLYQSGSFEASLLVDRNGLVVDYPGLWRRLPIGRHELRNS